jgi:hypothetical protein
VHARARLIGWIGAATSWGLWGMGSLEDEFSGLERIPTGMFTTDMEANVGVTIYPSKASRLPRFHSPLSGQGSLRTRLLVQVAA